MSSNNVISMCAAGSGKTWNICNESLENVSNATNTKRILITTYTNKGIETINNEIAKQNFGVPSQRITVRTWYQFLLTELIRPYQSYIVGINQIKSFDFSDRYGQVNYGKKGEPKRYFGDKQTLIKKDNASELALFLNEQSHNAVIERLEKVYSHIYIDEMQDMAGHDLSIVEMLFDSEIAITCVGDNKQATYHTHNTRKNIGKSGKNLWEFCDDKQHSGVVTIKKSMISRRFNSNICAFANSVYPNANNITSCMTETSLHDGVFLIKRADIASYLEYYNPVILKYDSKTDTGGISSYNYGQCKGMTFERVLIFPNKPLLNFLNGSALNSPEKYYVAVTRAKYSLAIVVDQFPVNTLYESVDVQVLGHNTIQSLRFVENISRA